MNKNLKPVIAVAGLSLAFSVAFTGLVSCDKGGNGGDETTTNPSIYDSTADPAATSDPTASSSDETTADPNEYVEVDETVYVTVEQVNLRSEPKAIESTYVTTGYYGNSFKRIKYSENWSVILVGEEELYVSSDCVSTTDPTKLPVEFNAVDKTVYVTTSKLNLRTYPSTESALGIIHAVVEKDTELVAIGLSTDGKWYKISYDEKVLYVSADSVSDRLVGSDFTAVDKKVQITADTLNVRKIPSSDNNISEIVGAVGKGTVVTVIGVSPDGNWYKVKFTPNGGTEGEYYMSASSNYSKDAVDAEASTTTEATGK